MQIFDKQYTTKKVSKFETDCNYFLGKLCRKKKTNKTKTNKLYKQRKTITKTTKKREQKQMKSFYPIRSC